jgi:hypothetical protein
MSEYLSGGIENCTAVLLAEADDVQYEREHGGDTHLGPWLAMAKAATETVLFASTKEYLWKSF